MEDKYLITIIIPFYNAANHIQKCLDSLINQDFTSTYEIIMINDASSDNSKEIVDTYNLKNLKNYNLEINSGPAKARNVGLKYARGKYITFLDVDDSVEKNFLSLLHFHALQGDYDFIFCDTKWIDNSTIQRKNSYMYDSDKEFEFCELKNCLKERLLNLSSKGILDCKGKLIRGSIIRKNKIYFDDQLRYLEDEIFLWDVIPFVKRAKYIHKKLYCYFVYPGETSGVVEGLNLGFKIEKFKLIRNHIKKSFLNLNCQEEEATFFGNQALIFFIINVLISYSKSILQEKVDRKKGLIERKNIITSILNDIEVFKAIRKYKRLKGENILIPFGIFIKSTLLLEISCTKRANYILNIRQKNKKNI